MHCDDRARAPGARAARRLWVDVPRVGVHVDHHGRGPRYRTALLTDAHAQDGRITSSPVPTSRARSARWSADVPEFVATAPAAPTCCASASSKSATCSRLPAARSRSPWRLRPPPRVGSPAGRGNHRGRVRDAIGQGLRSIRRCGSMAFNQGEELRQTQPLQAAFGRSAPPASRPADHCAGRTPVWRQNKGHATY